MNSETTRNVINRHVELHKARLIRKVKEFRKWAVLAVIQITILYMHILWFESTWSWYIQGFLMLVVVAILLACYWKSWKKLQEGLDDSLRVLCEDSMDYVIINKP